MTNGNFKSTKLFAWLRLLRPPNLLTVPGDPLAGFTLAYICCSPSTLPFFELSLCIMASFLLYSAGLLLNDYCDIELDLRTRPERPLPAGKVSKRSVLPVIVIFFVLAIIAAASAGVIPLVVSLILAGAVVSYNCMTKSIPFCGVLNMGICRALNLGLGASVLAWHGLSCDLVLISASGLGIYIASVTSIAASETQAGVTGAKRWMPAITLICWFTAICITSKLKYHGSVNVFAILAGIIIIRTIYLGSLLRAQAGPGMKQQTVGKLICTLPLTQAALISLAGKQVLPVCGVLLLAWIASSVLGRYFYSS